VDDNNSEHFTPEKRENRVYSNIEQHSTPEKSEPMDDNDNKHFTIG
jgi:hypothetical protein